MRAQCLGCSPRDSQINKENSECIIQKLKVELMIVRAELGSAKNMLQMSEQENYKMKLIIDHLRNRVTELMNIDVDVEIRSEDIFQTDTSAANVRENEELVRSKQEADMETLKIVIKSKIREIMKKVDLDDITSKSFRQSLEAKMKLRFKPLIDEEISLVLG